MRTDKKTPLRTDKKAAPRNHKRGVVGYSKKTALLEDAITQMNAGKYGRSSAALKELLALDPHNMEARRLFATLHLRLGSLIPARQAFDSLISEAFERQDYWLAESLLREYLAVGPRCVPFLEKLGAVYQGKGDALEAVAEYGKAIEILLEDPDPDHPHHAAQLYAKIRELAPASPIAFRLASFFDAQTGELVAGLPAAGGEAADATPLSPAADEAPAAASIPEPVGGVVPWEQVEDSTGATAFPPAQESVLPSESPVLPEEAGALPQQETAPADMSAPSDSPAVAQCESGLCTQTDTRVEIPEAVHISEPIEAPQTEETCNLVPGALCEDTSAFGLSLDGPQGIAPDAMSQETPATLRESDAIQALAHEPLPPLPLSLQELDSSSPQIQQESVAAVVSAPMPWEQVQEFTITIPDHVPDIPTVPVPQTDGGSTASLPEPESSAVGQDESHAVAPSISVEAETGRNSLVTEEPVVVPSPPVPDQAPDCPLAEKAKEGRVSWESLFDTAWKFGEMLSSSAPQPETAQAAAMQIEEAPIPTTMSSLPAAAPEAEAIEIPESHGESSPSDSTAAAAVGAPMPWDQVEESTVTIPPAQVEEMVAEPSTEQSVPSASPMESVSELRLDSVPDPAESPSFTLVTSCAPEADSFSITQPPAAPPSLDPEFRLAGSAPVFSLHEDHTTGVETEHPPSTSAEVSEPPKSGEPEPPLFKIVDSLPTVEVVPTTPPHSEPAAPTPPTFSTSLSVSTVEIAPVETQPEIVPPLPVREEHPDPAPTPQAVAELPADQVDPQVPVAPPAPQAAVAPESVAESGQVSERLADEPFQWKSGDMAVQTSPPLSKDQERISEPAAEIALAPLSSEDTAHSRAEQEAQEEAAFAEARAHIPESGSQQEEWIRAGESIRFIQEPQASTGEEPISPAATAVDVLFDSSGHVGRTRTQERAAKPCPRLRSKLNRSRIWISVFLSSSFSTTRAVVTSLVALVLLSGALVALGIGAVGLTWIIMEESPSPAFQSLTTNPPRTLLDSRKNGYLLLLGFDAPAGQDPIRVGYERTPDANDAERALACRGGPLGGARVGQLNASANVANGWFHGPDPAGQFTLHQDTIKGWVSREESTLGRYQQWQKLLFEDWGYGKTVSPPCASIVFARQLYLADGFVQGTEVGVDRLEADMEAWRMALGEAKTIPVKTLALQAINDGIAVASGLLMRPDFDDQYLSRITKMLRPLDQVELSIRWPMQSELVSAAKTFDVRLKAEREEEQAFHAVVASALPLPKQRRFNDYAEYYEASYKAAGEGRYGSLPKWKHYLHFPAETVMDYLSNPIENLVGLEPLAAWDFYSGLVVDTDAHLRLAGLQAWLRRGPQDADLLTRIAKAGQNFYDPYTGLPMLVNLKKDVMYSVGHDGKDQDADPQLDVVVTIPRRAAPPMRGSSDSPRSK